MDETFLALTKFTQTWGLAYFIVPRLCGVKLWSEKLGVATSILWNVIILSAVVTLLGGSHVSIA